MAGPILFLSSPDSIRVCHKQGGPAGHKMHLFQKRGKYSGKKVVRTRKGKVPNNNVPISGVAGCVAGAETGMCVILTE